MENLVAWASLVGGIAVVFEYLERTVSDEARSKVADWLQEYPNASFDQRLRAISSTFISLFDVLYKPRHATLSRNLWAGIIGGMAVCGILRATHSILDFPPPEAENLLAFAVSMILALAVVSWSIPILHHPRRYLRNVLLSIVSVTLFALSIRLFYPQLNEILGINLDIWSLIRFEAFIFPIAFVVALSTILLRKRDSPVSPIRAFIFSLIAVFIVSLFTPHLAHDFVKLGLESNPTVFSYVGLNLFADAISLLQTYWFLCLARKSRFSLVLLLLTLDLVASALIFLMLPLLLGEVDVVASAIRFSGPKPWMGIFFWSTFFTSAAFYVFVLSAIGAGFVYRSTSVMNRLAFVFPVERQPFRVLGLVAMLIATAICLIVAVWP